MKFIVTLIFILCGCSDLQPLIQQNDSTTSSIIINIVPENKYFHSKINSIEYLLEKECSEMLENLSKKTRNLQSSLILEIQYNYSKPSEKISRYLTDKKYHLDFTLKYNLYDAAKKPILCDEIKITDGFYSTTNQYVNLISMEEILNIEIKAAVRQLETELLLFFNRK